MAGIMKQHCLEFTEPGKVRIIVRPEPQPSADQVLVQTTCSAISPGTEMLVYRGLWPANVPTDSAISTLKGTFSYPLFYGYCAVGRVVDRGAAVPEDFLGRRVFAFHPHQDLFCISPAELHLVPDDLDDETALFLPGMETAVNLLLDGSPLIGEKVIVVGQGIIGLLTAALLCRFPLAAISTVDAYPSRREASMNLGNVSCFDPADPEIIKALGGVPGQGGEADLVYELSGNPAGLSLALSLVRYSGRVVIGSWYGARKADLDLGSFFHRGRVSFTSSQVSSLAPELTGRWQKGRRIHLAWEMLRQVRPSSFITHRFPLSDAPLAYSLIDEHPEETILVILDHQPTDNS
jgi:2-desacetyl-2-hydroxyethyl bacteriochlorophyllide A dehydrogenase